jgi:hypothetical protein
MADLRAYPCKQQTLLASQAISFINNIMDAGYSSSGGAQAKFKQYQAITPIR